MQKDGDDLVIDHDERTDRALERAALELLTAGGLLSGFTLSDVGTRAGVTRSLVYHYFGDRQSLLRSALRHGAAELQHHIKSIPYSSYGRRLTGFLRFALKYPVAVQLSALGVIDNDRRTLTMPIREQTMESFARDVAEGYLPHGTDLEALLGVQNCLIYGYVIFRHGLARQVGVDVEKLDKRFASQIEAIGEAAATADWTGEPMPMPVVRGIRRKVEDTSTPGLLEAAALALLEENGVLAGVNLKKVAERAGVQRSLVYHYFDTRRELVLSALRRRRTEALEISTPDGVPGDLLFASVTKDSEPVHLMALLAIDGDVAYEPLGTHASRLDEVMPDLVGACMAYGHAIYREPFAREMGATQRAWDRRVFAAWARIASALW